MKTFIRENTWISIVDHGFGNGYVLIPKGHQMHGKDYDDIPVDVHGGLTFSELVDKEFIKEWNLSEEDEGTWCVGFDTAHYEDNINNWPEQKVKEETERLKEQLIKLK